MTIKHEEVSPGKFEMVPQQPSPVLQSIEDVAANQYGSIVWLQRKLDDANEYIAYLEQILKNNGIVP